MNLLIKHKLLAFFLSFSSKLCDKICYKATFYLFDKRLYKIIKAKHPIIFKHNRSFPNSLLLKEKDEYGLNVAFYKNIDFLIKNNIKKAILIKKNNNYNTTKDTHMVFYYNKYIYDNEYFFRYQTKTRFFMVFYPKQK